MPLLITLVGTPRPLPRPRFIRGRAVSIASPKAKAYALALQRAAREAVSNYGPDAVRQEFARHGLAVSILAEFPTRRTERWGQAHTVRSDGDNIAKAALDHLQKAGALGGDDSRVAELVVVKRWAARGKLSITITAIEHDTPEPPSCMSVLEAPGWLITK